VGGSRMAVVPVAAADVTWVGTTCRLTRATIRDPAMSHSRGLLPLGVQSQRADRARCRSRGERPAARHDQQDERRTATEVRFLDPFAAACQRPRERRNGVAGGAGAKPRLTWSVRGNGVRWERISPIRERRCRRGSVSSV